MSSLQDSSLLIFKAPRASYLRSPCTFSTITSLQTITAIAYLTDHISISCPPNIWKTPVCEDYCCRQDLEPLSSANTYLSSMSMESFQSASTIFDDAHYFESPTIEQCGDCFNDPDSTLQDPLDNARFFVIKSYSALDVYASFDYHIWSSTDLGNKRLSKAYRETSGDIYLFFSVNGSAKFCGVAKMLGDVDFTKASDIWAESSRWKGIFPVEWLAKEDIPNRKFHHMLVPSNENKPVSNSRDTQEVPHEIGLEMLQIFGAHPTR